MALVTMTGAGLMEAVAAIWAEVLGISDVGPDSDFLALGGHSLAAIRVTARVRELVGPDVPLELIFEAATLADYVEGLTRSS